MLEALKFFQPFALNNLGGAIILLTIAVKIALYPLTLQSTQQMLKMSRVQPELAEIQKKFKGQPEKLQKAMMELYKQHKVNPLGGCLPMLLQIPFFIALFFALNSKEFVSLAQIAGTNAHFLWIKSLTAHDPYYILTVLIGLTTYWTQKVTPMAGSDQQKQMMLFMPIFITFISAGFPAGVQLYWVVQNLLTVAQQAYIIRHKV